MPTVSISTPTNGPAFTTSPITVSGVAQIDQSPPADFPPSGLIVTLVQVQMNGTDGAGQTASGTTNLKKAVRAVLGSGRGQGRADCGGGIGPVGLAGNEVDEAAHKLGQP